MGVIQGMHIIPQEIEDKIPGLFEKFLRDWDYGDGLR
jgi:hypothetical protein